MSFAKLAAIDIMGFYDEKNLMNFPPQAEQWDQGNGNQSSKDF